MKHCKFYFLFTTVSLVWGISSNCEGQLSGSSMSGASSGPTTPSSQIQNIRPYDRPKNSQKGESVSPYFQNIPLSPRMPATLNYFHPGVLIFQEGKWEGNDHLLNVANNIGVYASLIKPEGLNFPIEEEAIKSQVVSIFQKVNISPVTLAAQDQPPLPAFQIEVLVYPIEKGYVASIQGRLFESVVLSRFVLDPGMAFQAVTWEKKNLIVAPKDKIVNYLQDSIADVANSFTERYEAFQKMKNESRR